MLIQHRQGLFGFLGGACLFSLSLKQRGDLRSEDLGSHRCNKEMGKPAPRYGSRLTRPLKTIKQGTRQSFCFSKTLYNSELIYDSKEGERRGREGERERKMKRETTTARQQKAMSSAEEKKKVLINR